MNINLINRIMSLIPYTSAILSVTRELAWQLLRPSWLRASLGRQRHFRNRQLAT